MPGRNNAVINARAVATCVSFFEAAVSVRVATVRATCDWLKFQSHSDTNYQAILSANGKRRNIKMFLHRFEHTVSLSMCPLTGSETPPFQPSDVATLSKSPPHIF